MRKKKSIPRDPTPIELLQAEIDARLGVEVLCDFAEEYAKDQFTLPMLLAYMRACYGRGYMDCFEEEQQDKRGALLNLFRNVHGR